MAQCWPNDPATRPKQKSKDPPKVRARRIRPYHMPAKIDTRVFTTQTMSTVKLQPAPPLPDIPKDLLDWYGPRQYLLLRRDGVLEVKSIPMEGSKYGQIPLPEGYRQGGIKLAEQVLRSADGAFGMLYVFLMHDDMNEQAEGNEGLNMCINGAGDMMIFAEFDPTFNGCPPPDALCYAPNERDPEWATADRTRCIGLCIPQSLWRDMCHGLADLKHRSFNPLSQRIKIGMDAVTNTARMVMSEDSVNKLGYSILASFRDEFKHQHAEIAYVKNDTSGKPIPAVLIRSEKALTKAWQGLRIMAIEAWPCGYPVPSFHDTVMGGIGPYYFDDPTTTMGEDLETMCMLMHAVSKGATRVVMAPNQTAPPPTQASAFSWGKLVSCPSLREDLVPDFATLKAPSPPYGPSPPLTQAVIDAKLPTAPLDRSKSRKSFASNLRKGLQTAARAASPPPPPPLSPEEQERLKKHEKRVRRRQRQKAERAEAKAEQQQPREARPPSPPAHVPSLPLPSPDWDAIEPRKQDAAKGDRLEHAHKYVEQNIGDYPKAMTSAVLELAERFPLVKEMINSKWSMDLPQANKRALSDAFRKARPEHVRDRLSTCGSNDPFIYKNTLEMFTACYVFEKWTPVWRFKLALRRRRRAPLAIVIQRYQRGHSARVRYSKELKRLAAQRRHDQLMWEAGAPERAREAARRAAAERSRADARLSAMGNTMPSDLLPRPQHGKKRVDRTAVQPNDDKEREHADYISPAHRAARKELNINRDTEKKMAAEVRKETKARARLESLAEEGSSPLSSVSLSNAQAWHLPKDNAFRLKNGDDASVFSVATSSLPLPAPCPHAVQRGVEHDVERRWLQDALKNGDAEAQPGGRVKHRGKEATIITDADATVVITTWPTMCVKSNKFIQ